MKTVEFMNEIRELGLYFKDYRDMIFIYSDIEQSKTIACIYTDIYFSIDTVYREFERLEDHRKERLINLIIDYVKTPIEERKKEKKYYLRHKWLSYNGRQYLNLYINENECLIDTKHSYDNIKTQFTQAQIEDIKKKFNTNLEDFEMVEVEG